MADDMSEFKRLIARVGGGERLSTDDAYRAFDIMMSGNATPSQMGAFLMGLRVRGETVEEITGGAKAMRDKALAIEAPAGAIDTCGTGGDASGTLNVSTATSLVVAACGVPVAKHGNRALSSRSGAADVLAALGVNIDADMSLVRRALWEANICFLMAPRHHSAMRHVGPGPGSSSAPGPCSTCIGPLSSPARHQAPGGRRVLAATGPCPWPRCARQSRATSAPGSCTAPTAWTSCRPPAPRWSPS